MIPNDVLVPAASAATGALTFAYIGKALLRSWLQKHDEMALAVSAMAVELGKVQVHIGVFQNAESNNRGQIEKIGAHEFRLKSLEEHYSQLIQHLQKGH